MDRGWKGVLVGRQMSWHHSEHYRDTFELGTKPCNAHRGPSSELGLGEGCILSRPNAAAIEKKQLKFF